MKLLFADKSTQSDEYKYIQIVQENGNISMRPSISRQPPERPPPPKLKNVIEAPIPKTARKKSGIDNLFKDMRIKKRFNTLKENTKKLTKTMHNKMTKRIEKSQSVIEVSKSPTTESQNYIDESSRVHSAQRRSENLITPSSEVMYRPKMMDQMDRSLSLSHKSAPPIITKTVRNVMSLEDMLNENESMFAKFPVTPLITDFFTSEPSETEITDFDQIVDNCLNVFMITCHRQIKDTINDINDHFSQSLDLDSIGLLSNQPEFYTIYCVPGWKQMRIIEDTKTKERFLSLKNSSYQSWVLLNQNRVDIKKRWICFPITSISTLDNEIALAEEDGFQKRLLKMIMLICITSIYKDENFPKNIDPSTILIVSSKCGIILIFREGLNASELYSLDLLECNSIDSIPDLLKKSKLDIQQLIANFFQRPEVLSILISSTWPLDYLALMMVELITDNKE